MEYILEFNEFTNNKVKVFKYDIIKTEPLSELEKYKNHRRLKVFYHKGTKCVNCGKEGTQIIYGKDKVGDIHKDICTDDLLPLTVDHIHPKSKGGSNKLKNLQPMCVNCNTLKADYEVGDGKFIDKLIQKKHERKPLTKRQKGRKAKRYIAKHPESQNINIGDIVYRSVDGSELGEVIDVLPNPHHPFKNLGVKIKDRSPKSIYNLDALFKYL